jgi:hypothetical protein
MLMMLASTVSLAALIALKTLMIQLKHNMIL